MIGARLLKEQSPEDMARNTRISLGLEALQETKRDVVKRAWLAFCKAIGSHIVNVETNVDCMITQGKNANKWQYPTHTVITISTDEDGAIVKREFTV